MANGDLIVLAMAKRGFQLNDGAAEAFYQWPCRKHQVAALVKPITTLLTHGFNQAWAGALNFRDQCPGVKYFAMIHDDIEPEKFWVDTLIEELERLGADVVGAVAPIKDAHGLTSTAIDTGDIWLPHRLTMTEVMNLPETFGAEDVGGPLLLNTGLWVADISKPWAEEVCFDFLNRIRRLNDGTRVAEAVPEDWLNSRNMNELGCKLYATRKVKLIHQGVTNYPNDHAWGEWQRDEVYFKRIALKEQVEACASNS